MFHFRGIVASDRNGLIGYNRKPGAGRSMPWETGSLRADLRFFRRVTAGKAVVMGRKTLESIGFLLPGRCNLIFSSRESLSVSPGPAAVGRQVLIPQLEEVWSGLRGILESGSAPGLLFRDWAELREIAGIWSRICSERTVPPPEPEIFVIGGSEVFSSALRSGCLDDLYWSRVEADFPAPPDWEPVYLPPPLLRLTSPDYLAENAQLVESLPADGENAYPVEIFLIPIERKDRKIP